MAATLVSLILLAVFITSLLSGIFGMAGGLILMGVLTAMLPVGSAMAVHGFAQLIANGTRAVTLFRHIRFRSTVFYLIGFALAAVLMWFFAYNPSRAFVYLSLGAIPFITFLPRTPRLDFLKARDAFVCGFVVTVAHMMAGVSGPILDMFFVRSEMNRFEMIGTKALTQCLGHTLKIVYFGLLAESGMFESFPIWFPALVIVTSITGTQAGGWILKKMSEVGFKYYLRRLFILVGSVYLVMGIRELF